jgi:hypothetical protein
LNSDGRISISFSFPQCVDGFECEISKMYIQRIPKTVKSILKNYRKNGGDEWTEFFKKVTSQFREHKGR